MLTALLWLGIVVQQGHVKPVKGGRMVKGKQLYSSLSGDLSSLTPTQYAVNSGHCHLQELLEFTDDQIQDVLYLRRIVAARAHDLEKQRHEATARMLSQASIKQHPSDHLAESQASSQELKLIGMEEYKLHGTATDALANGVSHRAALI